MCRRRAQKGAARSGARLLARWLLHQNPPEDRLRRPSHRIRPDRRREGRRAALPDPARARSRGRAARGDRRQGLRQQGQPPGGAGSRHHSRHSTQGQREGQAGLLRQDALQRPRPHRAGRRQDQALQARRPTLREGKAKFRILRRPLRRLHLDQFRPHGLTTPLVFSEFYHTATEGRKVVLSLFRGNPLGIETIE